MRKLMALFFAFVLCGCLGSLQAQVVNVPARSKEHFLKTYTAAKDADWSNNVTNYTVKFKSGNATMRAHYRLDGTWEFTETLLTKNDLPEAVKSSFGNSRFSDWEIVSVTKVDNDNKQHLYRIEAKKGISKEHVFYDKNGKEIKTSVKL